MVFIISSYFSVFLNLLLHECITNAFGKNKQNPTKSISKAIYTWKSFSPRKWKLCNRRGSSGKSLPHCLLLEKLGLDFSPSYLVTIYLDI